MRYTVTGTQPVVDPATDERVDPGGVLDADPFAWWTGMQVDAGVLTAVDDEPPTAAAMPCPLCAEQGKKRAPTFANADELTAHYTDRHEGFVVPAFEAKEA